MGREVRRVPPWWEHPKNKRGGWIPMYDQDFMTARRNWQAHADAWASGRHPDLMLLSVAERAACPRYEDWNDVPPNDPRWYRPAWSEDEATAFQLYETTTEGTPLSPVCPTLDALVEWCVSEGKSREDARSIVQDGLMTAFERMTAQRRVRLPRASEP
jgi:hypothetical protein